MAGSTTVYGIPYPENADNNNIAVDIQAVATRVDAMGGVEVLTQTQINALTTAKKPAGRLVFNSTTGKYQTSNGSTFSDLADATKLPLAGGTMSGPIAMGTNKITGLGDGSSAQDAVSKSQLDAVSTVASAALPKAGGTMTGKITLDGDPSANLHAATKQYTDTMLPKAGGTMTGKITLDGDPSSALHAATKQYTDTMLPKSGGTMTGKITLDGAPTSDLHAASKAYVDALGVWQDWTPTWPNATATLTSARYTRIGNTIHWSMSVSAVGTTDYIVFTLPVTARSNVRIAGQWAVPLDVQLGTTSYLDFGPVQITTGDATRAVLQRIAADGASVAAMMPASQVANIGFHASGTYEAA